MAPLSSPPSIGRIVHYQAHGSPNGQHKPAARAAVITEVIDNETVGLCVMSPTGFFFNQGCKLDQTDVPAGGTWRWPPRI